MFVFLKRRIKSYINSCICTAVPMLTMITLQLEKFGCMLIAPDNFYCLNANWIQTFHSNTEHPQRRWGFLQLHLSGDVPLFERWNADFVQQRIPTFLQLLNLNSLFKHFH